MGKPAALPAGVCRGGALAKYARSIILKSLGTLTFFYTESRVTSAF